jgi:hypothetical protein
MRSFRILLAAILLASCPWPHLGAQISGQHLSTPPVPNKILPAGVPDKNSPYWLGPLLSDVEEPRNENCIGPFTVVKDKRDEVFTKDLPLADSLKFLLGVKPVQIENLNSIKEIAPNGEIFKWVLIGPPEGPPECRQLWAIPILNLTRPPVELPPNSNNVPRDPKHLDVFIDNFIIATYKDNNLQPIGDDILKHVIVTRGKPVLSAGEAQRQVDKLVIDNHSGHYHPTFKSVKDRAVSAFVNAGFKRENIEVHNENEKKRKKYFKGAPVTPRTEEMGSH